MGTVIVEYHGDNTLLATNSVGNPGKVNSLTGTWTLTGNELKMVVEGIQAVYTVSVTVNTMVITTVMAENHVSNSLVSKTKNTYTKM